MNESTASPRAPSLRDDRILAPTKWLAALIIPFLVAAFYILYLRPNETGELFAWRIAPTMTAMMLASAYLGGIYYFTGVLLARRWHHVKAGMLPVAAFASILGVATILHWDRFTPGHVSFVTWTTLYWVAPFLVIGAWLRNRVHDPGTPDADDARIPIAWRWAIGCFGLVTLVFCLLLFLQPAPMIAAWPWKLTPLTARVEAALFALPAVVGLGLALDPRWSSARLIVQAQGCSIVFILIATVRAWGEFDRSSPGTYAFVGGMGLTLAAIVAFHVVMEARRAPRP